LRPPIGDQPIRPPVRSFQNRPPLISLPNLDRFTSTQAATSATSDHLKVFANEAAAEAWFKEHEPEGVAFEYELIE